MYSFHTGGFYKQLYHCSIFLIIHCGHGNVDSYLLVILQSGGGITVKII